MRAFFYWIINDSRINDQFSYLCLFDKSTRRKFYSKHSNFVTEEQINIRNRLSFYFMCATHIFQEL